MREAAAAELRRFIQGKLDQLRASEELYRAAIGLGPTPWRAAAMLRIAQLYVNLAVMLTLSAPPSSMSPQIQRAYCGAIQSQSEPLLEKAVEGLTACQLQGVLLGAPTKWTQACEQLLHSLQPKRWPRDSEIFEVREQPIPLDSAPPA